MVWVFRRREVKRHGIIRLLCPECNSTDVAFVMQDKDKYKAYHVGPIHINKWDMMFQCRKCHCLFVEHSADVEFKI